MKRIKLNQMDQIAAILLNVQTQLGESVPELAYIDKDWGQLSYEVPSVQWPCALLDVENVNYTQEGGGRQMADTQLTITVADMRITPASLTAPRREEAYRIIELLGKIHRSLHYFSAGDYAPLFRTNLKKVVANSSYECYRLTYQTAFEIGFDTGAMTSHIQGVQLNLK